MGVFEKHETL